MNPKCCRYFYGSSNKRLRRARRLYAYLIFEGCWNGGAPTILECAKKAKEHGLYASVTADKDVAWSIYRKMFKLSMTPTLATNIQNRKNGMDGGTSGMISHG